MYGNSIAGLKVRSRHPPVFFQIGGDRETTIFIALTGGRSLSFGAAE
jgi:hypothetical protein